ncbi:MAG: hypothetical protein PW789_15155 [Edaphobacter sp.]|uniref:hypothetical protein n=1 Tax=Edaphobacter sp. TaxID=1934404 RepID=UPI0023A2B1F8|nr:hypothetical protein [Edaphobacter sp.]MDE1177916.1 hypothetical protein [Edaphobacter sp.]
MAPNAPSRRPRLAAVVTAYKKYLHPQHVVDRLLDGYGWNGTYHRPQMDVVSLYVDQRDEGDLTQERADRHPEMKICPSIEEALTLGTSKLAVDGVVVVAEHGVYPLSPNGIMMRPHYEFFEKITNVYRSSGRAVPYFNDKELSWRWDWSKKMVDVSHELGFPFQSGSSLAVTWRLPSVEFPLGATAKEALSIGYGGMTSYDFHGLETIQCMVERRKGGETGVEWIQTYTKDAFWKAYEEGVWSKELMRAALSRSSTLRPADPTFTNIFPTLEQMKALVPEPVAYHYKHRDGLRCTMLLLNGLVRDFTFAANIDGHAKPFSTQMYLPMPDGRTTLASFFSPLVYNAEQMFLTGKQQYPIERNLMTSGLLIEGVESYRQGKRLETPNLAAVQYQPIPKSTFWRS